MSKDSLSTNKFVAKVAFPLRIPIIQYKTQNYIEAEVLDNKFKNIFETLFKELWYKCSVNFIQTYDSNQEQLFALQNVYFETIWMGIESRLVNRIRTFIELEVSDNRLLEFSNTYEKEFFEYYPNGNEEILEIPFLELRNKIKQTIEVMKKEAEILIIKTIGSYQAIFGVIEKNQITHTEKIKILEPLAQHGAQFNPEIRNKEKNAKRNELFSLAMNIHKEKEYLSFNDCLREANKQKTIYEESEFEIEIVDVLPTAFYRYRSKLPPAS